jgi:hypothetical protein
MNHLLQINCALDFKGKSQGQQLWNVRERYRYGPSPDGLAALADCGKTIWARRSSAIPVKCKTVKREVNTLSPTSVDKSVNKVALPAKYHPFLYLQDVFA